MHKIKMQNQKMHKNETPQISKNSIPVQRGENESFNRISSPVNLPDIFNKLQNNRKNKEMHRFREGRTRV